MALSVHLTKAPPNAKGAKVLGIRAHLYIERAAMTDRNAAPITAVSVVDNSKYVCYVAVVVIASDDSFVDLVARLANVAKMPPNVRWQQIRRIRAHQCIDPAVS